MANQFVPYAFNFSKAYQDQVFAADQQRRANQGADSAFAQMAADDETDMTGQPTPQAPSTPMVTYGDGLEGPVDALEQDREVMSRAKRRASQYLSEAG
jgi:hypothetical protein